MTTETTTEKERVRPPDFWNLMAREVYGMPEGWEWFRLEAVGPHHRRDLSASMVTGAVCTETFKSGPNKGSKNWKKRDRSTEQTIAIPFKDLDAFCEKWEVKTGLCSSCGGSGENGWDANQRCTRCNGSGKHSPVV